MANTPEPGLENTYTLDGRQRGSFLIGVALEKSLPLTFKSIETAFGLEIDYLRNPSITGVVHPMVNVAPDFDTMNYSYNVTSYALQATTRISKANLINHFGLYIQVGVGGALNYLRDYTEISPPGSSAAAMLAPFKNDSSTHFAYSLGAGIIYQPGTSARVSLGYRYMNTGSGQFRKSPVQQSDNALNFPSISYQFFILSLST